jgi:hypothetical protein
MLSWFGTENAREEVNFGTESDNFPKRDCPRTVMGGSKVHEKDFALGSFACIF